MLFDTVGKFTLVRRETTETVSSYEVDDLVAQRTAVQAHRDAEIARCDAELARLDGLLSQCTAFGVASRATAALASVEDLGIATSEGAASVVADPPAPGIPSV